MRAVLLTLIVAVIAVIAAVATGFLDINQVRGVRAPEVAASGNGITASGGQAPAFDVETGSVRVGAQDANVRIPSLEIAPAANEAAPVANNAM